MHKGLHHTAALHPLWEPMRLLSLSPHYKKEAEVGKLAQGEQLTYGSCKFRCKSSLVWLQNPLLPNEMKMKGSRSVVSDSLWLFVNSMDGKMITTSPCLKQSEHSNTSELLLGIKLNFMIRTLFFFFFFYHYDNAKQPYLDSPTTDTQLTGLESHSPGKAQRFMKPLKSQCLILSTCTFWLGKTA